MGRGQSTTRGVLRDQFSAIFGNRRGAGRESERTVSQVIPNGKRWVKAFWKGTGVQPNGAVVFLFPWRLEQVDVSRVLDKLILTYGTNPGQQLGRGHLYALRGGSIFYVVGQDLIGRTD